MKPEIKRKWVKALLSGKYEQGMHKLKWDNQFCCIGVLRDVMDSTDTESFGGYGASLTDGQLQRFGLTREIQCELADGLNDVGVPFDMIAGLIDQAL